MPAWAQPIPARTVALTVEVDGHELPDRVSAAVESGQVLLPLGALAQMLTLAITVSAEKGRASGYLLSTARSFSLDLATSTVRIAEREMTFDARHVVMIGGDIHVASQMLAKWLPVALEVDLPAKRLRVTPRLKLPLQERLARLDTRTGRVPAAPPVSRRDLEANLLLLQLKLDESTLSDGLNAYKDGHEVLLPLGELARLLTLAITVNPEQGSAQGYVLREDRDFGLSVAQSMARLGGREQYFESRLATVIGDDVYVSSRLLAHWLPIDLKIDLASLQLRVVPRVKLPLQERLARQNAAARLGVGKPEVQDLGYPRVPSPYRLASAPFIDQTFGSQLRLAPNHREAKASYTAYLTGDLIGMEASAYLSASRDKASPDVRVTLGRQDPDGGLLGPLHARSAVAGHINLPNVPKIASSRPSGVGLSVSNRQPNQPTSFDRHSLRGDLPPGWDVTVFYNNALLGYQQARADGRYAFEDLPLSIGLNEFRLVFNGPLGQVRVENLRFLLDASHLKPGELLYTAAHQRAKDGDGRTVAQLDLGLTSSIAANAAWIRTPKLGSANGQAFAQLGLRGYWSSMIFNSQLTMARSGGALVDLGLKTRLGAFAVDLQHSQLQGGFESEALPGRADPLRQTNKLSVNGVISPKGLPALALALEATREAFRSGASQVGATGRVSTQIDGTSLSNSLRWQWAQAARAANVGPGAGALSAGGSLQASRRVLELGLNAQLDYELRPRTALQSFTLNADHSLRGGYRLNAGLQHQVSTGTSLLLAGVSQNLGRYGFAVNGSLSSRRELTLAVQLFVALGRDPRGGTWSAEAQPLAGSGAVSVQAFVDSNLNGVRDPGEEPVPNAGFIINGGGRHPNRTNSAGVAFLGRLTAGQFADIALDNNTLDDPQWRALRPGVRVLPRPGVVETIDFAVVTATEIDGTVHLVDKGKRRGIGDAKIELVDAQGRVQASTTSSPDGYYLLHQVLPGRFTLRIAPEQAAKLGLGGVLSRALVVPNNGDFINGQDFELKRMR